MITKDEIQELLHSTETYRVERTTSTGDMDKFQEAICAFANDNGGKNGGDVPNLSQVCPLTKKRMQVLTQKMQPPVQRLQARMKRLQVQD